MEQLTWNVYDRYIHLRFYDENGSFMGAILTPPSGTKPDITIEGQMVSMTTNLSIKITVVNFEYVYDTQAIHYIEVDMGYFGLGLAPATAGMGNIKQVYEVFTIEQSKTPPDKQVIFNCIHGTSATGILQQKYSFGDLPRDPDGYVKEVQYELLVNKWKDSYNEAVDNLIKGDDKLLPTVRSSMKIAKVVFIDQSMRTKMVVPSNIDEAKTLYNALQQLSSLMAVEKETADDGTVKVGGALFSVHDRTLYVANGDYEANTDTTNAPNIVKLDYVISAVRDVSNFTVVALFDPRVYTGKFIRIPKQILVGKGMTSAIGSSKVNEKANGFATPIVLPTTTFKFGTIRDNAMTIKAVGKPA